MSAHTVDMLLDERTRLVAKNAATSGHLWAAEFLLKRVDKLLADAIMTTPALAAHRDVLREEIHELLAEEREHPGADTIAGDTWPNDLSGEGVSQGEGDAPSPGILPGQPGPY